MITHFQEIFKGVSMKKTSLRNLLLVTLAVSVAKTFRINEIASRLPINVKTEKSKQKRLLRFLDTSFPLEAVKEVWCIFVLRCLWKKPQNYSFLLVDETELIDGWKAIVAAIPFRNRAIPVYWLIYRDQEIRDLTYKSHNKIVQDFCLKVYNLSLTASPKKEHRAPVFVFDRGFARAKYVIDFLKQRNIGFVMRICRNVGITVAGSSRRLDTLESGSYPKVLYHKTYQIPLNLYVVRNPAFKEPMYLISNVYEGPQIHLCYKRRMQIEHGFRDIKSTFGFGEVVLKKSTHPRIAVLWLIACFAYGLSFLSYEKAATQWAKPWNTRRKLYAVITVIKRVLTDTWTPEVLLTFLEACQRRGDTLLGTY